MRASPILIGISHQKLVLEKLSEKGFEPRLDRALGWFTEGRSARKVAVRWLSGPHRQRVGDFSDSFKMEVFRSLYTTCLIVRAGVGLRGPAGTRDHVQRSHNLGRLHKVAGSRMGRSQHALPHQLYELTTLRRCVSPPRWERSRSSSWRCSSSYALAACSWNCVQRGVLGGSLT